MFAREFADFVKNDTSLGDNNGVYLSIVVTDRIIETVLIKNGLHGAANEKAFYTCLSQSGTAYFRQLLLQLCDKLKYIYHVCITSFITSLIQMRGLLKGRDAKQDRR